MPEHVHGCLNCRPDMVPDFDQADPRYHDGSKCGYGNVAATLDGAPIEFTSGMFEGTEGWVLFAGSPDDKEAIHPCPCDRTHACVEPRFGVVAVTHGCPSHTVAEVARLQEAIRKLVPDQWADIVYGDGA